METSTSTSMTAQARYEQLAVQRTPFTERAEEAARYTIPTLFPAEGETAGREFPTPYQSVGARGVNHLASKFLLVLFPPGSSFFRMTLDDFVVEELRNSSPTAKAAEDARAAMEEALSKIERAVMNRMEQRGSRSVLFLLLLHLIVAGNGLLQVLPDGALKFYSLRQYVVKRDLDGNVLEIITKETLSRAALPDKVRLIVERTDVQAQDANPEKSVDLYTRVMRFPNGGWRSYQEVCGERIPGTESQYPKNKSAFIPLRYSVVPGEDYGRGYVEAYLGDLRSLESLSKSVVDFAAVAARILFLVPFGSQTDLQELEEAPNGAFVHGDRKEVTALGLEKFPDFQIAKSTADEITHRLELAFLLNSAVQRDAERVTAEEIRFMAGELEQSHAGAYSVLAQELQLPLAERYMHQMARAGELPALPEKTVRPQIVTGIDGLGRTTDLMKLDTLFAGVSKLFGPDAVASATNINAYIQRGAAHLGIDISGIVKTPEEMQQERAQSAQQDLLNRVAPEVVKAATAQPAT